MERQTEADGNHYISICYILSNLALGARSSCLEYRKATEVTWNIMCFKLAEEVHLRALTHIYHLHILIRYNIGIDICTWNKLIKASDLASLLTCCQLCGCMMCCPRAWSLMLKLQP